MAPAQGCDAHIEKCKQVLNVAYKSGLGCGVSVFYGVVRYGQRKGGNYSVISSTVVIIAHGKHISVGLLGTHAFARQ
jgi:hypothetical protein